MKPLPDRKRLRREYLQEKVWAYSKVALFVAVAIALLTVCLCCAWTSYDFSRASEARVESDMDMDRTSVLLIFAVASLTTFVCACLSACTIPRHIRAVVQIPSVASIAPNLLP